METKAEIAVTTNFQSATKDFNDLSKKVTSLKNEIDKTGQDINKFGDSWTKFAVKYNQAFELIKKGSQALKSVFDLAKEGAKFQEVSLYAKNAAERIGLSFDSMVKASQRGANGMASNFTIMKANLKALKGGLVASEKDFEQLWKIADASSDELGQSIEQTFEQITTAITTGNAKSLMSMGLLPDSFKKAGDSAELLKDRSKLLKTVIEQLGPKAEELGKYGETAADKFQQFENSLADLKTEIGEAFIPTAMEMVSWLKAIVEQAKYAKDQIEWWAGKEIKLPEIQNSVSGRIVKLQNQKSNIGSERLKYEREIEAIKKDGLYNDTNLLSWFGGQSPNDRIKELELKIRSIDSETARIDKQINYLKNNHLEIMEAEKREEETAIKNAEAKEKQKQATENYNKIADTLSKQTLTGLNKALGITNNTISDNIQMMHNVGMASLGFSNQVDKGAAKAYEAMKKLDDEVERLFSAFDESVNKENVATEFAIELENLYRDDMPTRFLDTLTSINELDFKDTVKGLKDISSALQGDYTDIYFSGIPLFTSEPTELQRQEQMNKASAAMSAFGMNLFTAIPTNTKHGIFAAKTIEATEKTIDKTSNYLHDQFASGIANAIADGFASADFSGFASSLQSVISGVVGSGVSASISSALTKTADKYGVLGNGLFKQVVNDSGKISLGALGSNLLTGGLIGTATNFLFGEGGIFGKTKIVGKENLNKSAELNAQVDQAKELAESIYLATGISDATRELIDNAVYNKTWTTTHKSKNIFKKKKTITLHGAEQAQASIKYVEDLQKQALAEQAMNNYNSFMLGRDDSVAASYNNYLDAQKAYDASQVMLYSDEEKVGFQSQIDDKLARVSTLKNRKIENKNKNVLDNNKGRTPSWFKFGILSYGGIDKEINSLNSEITSLREKLNSSYKYDLETRTEMLKQMEEAHVNYIKAQQSARTNLLSNFTGSSTLASLVSGGSAESVMDMLLGNKDVIGNSEMVQTMLPLLEQAYTKDFDLNQRLNSSNDEVREAATKEQQSILERALSSYEKIYKDAKDEALNTNLSTEEQSAAFERWQETFQAYLSLQEQIAENTKTIADLEESNALSKLSTELGDMLSIVAEIKNQKSTNNTLVFRQSLSEEEIIAKLKAVVGAKNPELASALGEILNDRQNQSIWG